MKKDIDVAVIGAGIAGVSAAIYAKRAGLNCILLEPNIVGGQLWLMECVDNYVGVDTGIKGAAFAAQLDANLKALGVEPIKEKINKIVPDARGVTLITDEGSYMAKTAIIATGASARKAGVKGELDFAGKGVSYCAVCDGFFFRDKNVAIIGGGNTAVEEALYLSQMAKKVYLIHRRDKFRAMDYLSDQLANNDKIVPVLDSVVSEIRGETAVTNIIVENVKTNQTKDIFVDGVFVAIGVTPNTGFVTGVVDTNENGFIITDNDMQTSDDSILACGDCRERKLKQLITAASDGAIAALSAYKKIKGQYI